MYGDPAKIEQLAQQFRAEAGRAAAQADAIQSAAGAVQWEGSAADAFRDRMGKRRDACQTAQADLIAAADALAEHAARVRALLNEIARLQETITGWLNSAIDAAGNAAQGAWNAIKDVAGAVVDVFDFLPWKNWGFDPTITPPPGHKDWLDFGRRIAEQGVPL